jgi:DNA-binding NtrC family response regulator
MPKQPDNASILIGTSDALVAEKMPVFLRESFGRESVVVKDSSDFLLEALDKSIDLTIIDVTLDGLAAEKTIRIFKKSRPRVPVIVLSDDYTVETGSSIMEHGIFYYVYKPVEYGRLKDIVESALKKSEREAI